MRTFKKVDTYASQLVKRSVPDILHPPLRVIWRGVNTLHRGLSEAWLFISLLLHRLAGGSYLTWYSKKLNAWAASGRKTDIEAARRDQHLMLSGLDDLEIVKSFGLTPDKTLLEFGCGWMRAASHFIRYLDSGNYYGNDAAGERIRLGRAIFRLDELPDRKFNVFVNVDNSFDWMTGRKVDFIWCHAVFAHLPESDIDTIFRNARKVMHGGTQFLFTFNPVPDSADSHATGIVREDARNWMHPFGLYKEIGRRWGLEMAFHPEAMRGYKSIRPKECLGVARLAAPPAR